MNIVNHKDFDKLGILLNAVTHIKKNHVTNCI